MSKQSYAIPVHLDRSIMDLEIPLSPKGAQPVSVSMRVIMVILGSILFGLWFVSHTFMASADGWIQLLFLIWWMAATAYLATPSRTKELRYTQVQPLMEYIPRRSRVVRTRRDSSPGSFYSIVGIDSVDDSGYIHFSNGDCGQMYRVVGSASRLLFQEDQNTILDRVDSHWRKVDTGTEWIIITMQEPQRVYHQVASLERRNHRLEHRDPDLVGLMEERCSILLNHVGSRFYSIHQYLLLRSKSAEDLRAAHNILDHEAKESVAMMRQVTMLDKDGALSALRSIYGPVETLSSTR